MDVLTIFLVVLKLLWWVLPVFLLFVLLSFLKSATFKGWFGEKMVQMVAKRHLSPEIYHGFHDVMLSDDVGTTQIDHVYISVYGIFVIETKNYQGFIYVDARQPKWIQNCYGKKYEFQNPLRQNYRHIKVLQKQLKLPDGYFHSLVVFVKNCELKGYIPNNVCHLDKFVRYILSFKKPMLTKQDVIRLCCLLEAAKIANTFNNKRQHIQTIRQKYE